MKKPKLFIGIDVSKKKLDISFLKEPNQPQHHFIVANNKEGIKAIFKEVTKLRIKLDQLVVCFEHTGFYAMPLCFYLQEKNIVYAMVPSLEIHRSKGITRGKNDKADSKDIALYAFTHFYKLKFTVLPEKALMKLKILLAARQKIIRSLTAFKKSDEVQEFLPKDIITDALKINQKVLIFLEKSLKDIESKIDKLIKSDKSILKNYELACSVPGVGPQTALILISCTRSFTTFENWRKLACYAGIAPFEYSSGSSVRGRTKVSHIASKKLKSVLSMAALSAVQYDPQMKKYYERKVAEGKSKMLVLNAVRCKLVSRVFATIKRGTPYVKIENLA